MTAMMVQAASSEPPAPPRPGEPDKRALYSFARYTAQNDHYLGYSQIWTKTILFLMGRQWLRWIDSHRRWSTDTDVPPWRQQPVTNVTYAVYRSIATKMAKQRPTLEVVPPSGDSEDREAAQLGQAILLHLWRATKKPQKNRAALAWFLCTGEVYLRSWWDPEAGPRVPLTTLVEGPDPDYVSPAAASEGDGGSGEPSEVGGLQTDTPLDMGPQMVNRPVAVDPATGEPRRTEDGEYDFAAEPDLVPMGDVAYDVVDPMSVRFNPDARDPEDATEVYIGRLWPVTAAAKHFGVPEAQLTGADDSDRADFEDLMSSAASGAGWGLTNNLFGGAFGTSQQDATGPRCLVLEYYAKPSDRYPEGRHWIGVRDKIVWPKPGDATYPTGEAPLPNGFWPPIVPVQGAPVPGQPRAMGTLTQIVPLNEQLNTLDGKIKEHEVTMAMGGKWVVHPADKGLKITSDPAQVLVSAGYAAGHPPFQVQLNALPSEIYAERAVLMDKIRLVASQSEVDFGTKPEGVSAGRAFLVMQEVTDSVLGPDLQAWEEAFAEIGRRELVLCQRHYREERSIAIRGSRGQWEIRSFEGADLSDGLDVRVQGGSSFPWSKSAQWDTRLDLLSTFPQLVTDPTTGQFNAEAFARFMDTGSSGLDAFQSDENADLVEVQMEHAQFEALTPETPPEQVPMLAPWQAHPKHLEAHYEFMKRDRARFDRWTPFQQDAFLEHMRQTALAVDEIAAGLADASTAMVGSGGMEGQGAPSAPSVGADVASPGMESPTLQDADFASAGQ